MGFQIMGTEHLKARCICTGQSGTEVNTTGCPIHEKPKHLRPHGEALCDDCATTPEEIAALKGDPIRPKHYKGDSSIPFDCITVVRDLSFDVGNAVKYLWRTEMKNGREDLEKAKWYLEDAVKWNDPFYIGHTPMQFNARCAALIRAQTDPLRRKFFQALRAKQPQWMLQAVNEMLAQ